MDSEDYVIKRNQEKEIVSFDKILRRIKNLGREAGGLNVNYTNLCVKIIDRIYNNIPTSQIDELTSQQCASLTTTHPDYGTLAGRVVVSNHQKNTESDYLKVVSQLYDFVDVNGNHSPIISRKFYDFVVDNIDIINEWFDYSRDFLIDYFGFKTLERAYLMKVNGRIVERPQHMWMRVAIAIHMDDPDWYGKVQETYDMMSQKYFTHATPTLFNAGTKRQQMSSCYLLAMKNDSIDGIYDTLKQTALISKWAGGIGLHIHNVRADGTLIRGTNGTSNGIVPMLRVFNNTARYVDQGGGKRAGSFAMYMEPWHADIESFLDMKKNHGDEERRARDLFYALWMPDLFMKRVQDNGNWTLMCPHKCPGLSDVYGEKFEELYTKYETENRGNKTVKARDIWFKILDSQIETGTPYILYKDAANQKSNQKNLGTIKSSNLCTEIIEYSDADETAVCNLASISLSKMVKDEKQFNFQGKVILYTKNNCKWCLLLKALLKRKGVEFLETEIMEENFEEFKKNHNVKTLPQVKDQTGIIGGYDYCRELVKPVFDYELLHKITKIATKNLNKIIDLNFYPTPQTKNSNLKHRPIGLGVQGLADAYAKLDIPFHSEEAKIVNTTIFETIYHASLEASMEIARDRKPHMKALKISLTNKEWAFENSNASCNTYLSKTNIDITSLNKWKPIYNEFKLLCDEHLGAYSSFGGSPASQGKLQFDLWGVNPSTLYDWEKLKSDIAEHGLRNSLLVAPMPTASTSQILGNNECFEPFTSNIYVRRTIAGEFVVVNKYLLNELLELGLWTEEVKNQIIKNGGSIQDVKEIPKKLKEKYKIVWEIPMKHILDMCADRGAFICQSQSTNLWMKEPTYQKLTSMHFYSWKKGLKTGIYYLRTKAKAAPQQFTIEPDKKKEVVEEEEECLMCGS